ncbi:Hypothetical predicted protein [Mytilus galloprovincialis]|uniref:Uncharacterized protein n=1 Tax=Mytilus galloprovincialis TaxID=29158 RepID=A0A8B6DZT6_MYTGA|nr:Hypothetical predicted protein [Mytilus galloprovincialis]
MELHSSYVHYVHEWKNIYYLALVCMLHTCIVNGAHAPKGYERRKKSVTTTAPSNTTLQNTTGQSSSPSTNGTNTPAPSSTLNDTKTSAPSSNLKGPTTLTPDSITVKMSSIDVAVIGPITKTPVLVTTAKSGAETGSEMQSVNYYLQVGIAIYLLVCNKITTLTIKVRGCGMIA